MTAEEEMRVAEQRRALRAAMEELSNIEQTMTHVPFDSIYTCLCVILIQDTVASTFLLSLVIHFVYAWLYLDEQANVRREAEGPAGDRPVVASEAIRAAAHVHALGDTAEIGCSSQR